MQPNVWSQNRQPLTQQP